MNAATDSADSQKIDLKFASGWRATCQEFRRKMKDLGRECCDGQRGLAENGPRVSSSLEMKMQDY